MGLKFKESWKFECDNCHKELTYAVVPKEQRPPTWHRYADEFTEFDDFGNALRSHTKRIILCDECAPLLIPQRTSSPEAVMLASKYRGLTGEQVLDLDPDVLLADLHSLASEVLTTSPTKGDE